MGISACCCKESNMNLANKQRRPIRETVSLRNGNGMPLDGLSSASIVAPDVQQKRGHLSIKPGGFSLGAFAATNRGNLEDYYNIEKKVLGEGSYGSVCKCQNKETSQWCAVKTINKTLVKNPEQFKEEMAIMKLLDHPNIVRLYESFEDARNVYLVLELCTGGELFDRIVADGKFTEQAAASAVQQMLRAINYMHQNFIMHRDLKPENWLLANRETETEKMDLKLIDFGLSKRFVRGEFASTKAGTPYYVAPEVLEGRYAEQSDVWSIGVIMYILLSGSPPFSGTDTVAVLDSVRRAKPTFDKKEWKTVSGEAKQMLKGLLTRDPLTRSTAAEALKAAWLTMALEGKVGDAQVTTGVVANIKHFAVMNKLKKASLNIIATQLTDQSIKELKEMFITMDDNNDGTLSVGEIREGLQKAGVAIPPDLEEMMNMIDTDGSGVLDYAEFLAATLDRRKYIQEDVCWRAFKTLDNDGSGGIDKQELMKLLGVEEVGEMTQVAKITEQEVDAIMREVDLDGDGKISFEEFLTMMKKMPKGRTPRTRNNIGLGRKPA